MLEFTYVADTIIMLMLFQNCNILYYKLYAYITFENNWWKAYRCKKQCLEVCTIESIWQTKVRCYVDIQGIYVAEKNYLDTIFAWGIY